MTLNGVADKRYFDLGSGVVRSNRTEAAKKFIRLRGVKGNTSIRSFIEYYPFCCMAGTLVVPVLFSK